MSIVRNTLFYRYKPVCITLLPVRTTPLFICHFCVQELDAQNLSNLMHAYATLGVMPKRLAPAWGHELKRRLPCSSFTQQNLANLLWSLCIFEVRLLPTLCSTAPHCHRLATDKPLGHVSELPECSHQSVRTNSFLCGLCVCVLLCGSAWKSV